MLPEFLEWNSARSETTCISNAILLKSIYIGVNIYPSWVHSSKLSTCSLLYPLNSFVLIGPGLYHILIVSQFGRPHKATVTVFCNRVIILCAAFATLCRAPIKTQTVDINSIQHFFTSSIIDHNISIKLFCFTKLRNIMGEEWSQN